jgi:hypothetical protein
MIQNLIIALKITPVFVGIVLTAIGMLLLVYIITVVVFNKKARS